jgi:hypothetical protein
VLLGCAVRVCYDCILLEYVLMNCFLLDCVLIVFCYNFSVTLRSVRFYSGSVLLDCVQVGCVVVDS